MSDHEYMCHANPAHHDVRLVWDPTSRTARCPTCQEQERARRTFVWEAQIGEPPHTGTVVRAERSAPAQ